MRELIEVLSSVEIVEAKRIRLKKAHPGKRITDMLLVRTDHLNVDEYVYNAK